MWMSPPSLRANTLGGRSLRMAASDEAPPPGSRLPGGGLPPAVGGPLRDADAVAGAALSGFLYDLHLNAHTLPQDSFVRWLGAAAAARIGADAAWIANGLDAAPTLAMAMPGVGLGGASGQPRGPALVDALRAHLAAPAQRGLTEVALAGEGLRAAFAEAGAAAGPAAAGPAADGPGTAGSAAAEAGSAGQDGGSPAGAWRGLLAVALPEPPAARAGDAWLLLARHRDGIDGGFSFAERAQLSMLRTHLGLALALNRWEQRVRLNGPTSRLGRAHGVSARDGALLQADVEFLPLLRREWPRLDLSLPDAVLGLMQSAATRYAGKVLMLDCVPVQGGTWLWSVRLRHGVDALSARQLLVARLFADGRTYREIAATLQLAPATVRRHLQTTYSRLGVRNKIELVRALADAGPPDGAA